MRRNHDVISRCVFTCRDERRDVDVDLLNSGGRGHAEASWRGLSGPQRFQPPEFAVIRMEEDGPFDYDNIWHQQFVAVGDALCEDRRDGNSSYVFSYTGESDENAATFKFIADTLQGAAPDTFFIQVVHNPMAIGAQPSKNWYAP